MKLPFALSTGLVAAVLAAAPTAHATESSAVPAGKAPAAASAQWPTTLPMPKGMRPEGVAVSGTTAYAASFNDGSIWRGDLRTGKWQMLTPPTGAGQAIGLILDSHGRLWVAGGYAGNLRVIDAGTGKELATYQLTKDPDTAVNDLTVLDGALYITDSFSPYLYKLPLGNGRALPTQSQVQAIALHGMPYDRSNQVWNANGITPTPDGKALLIDQTFAGVLYRVDPVTGQATPVNVGGADVSWGDGMHLEGKTLYMSRNEANKVTVLRLNDAGSQGRLVTEVTDPRFDDPTSVVPVGNMLYITNGDFLATDPADTTYLVTAIPVPA